VSDLQAGPEIDAEIARRVFGLDTEMRSCHRKNCCGNSYLYSYEAEWLGWVRTSQYSTDIAAAWLVVEKMWEQTFSARMAFIGSLGNQISEELGMSQQERLAFGGWLFHLKPEHICRAALAAV
jgi:hypothetical protein